MKDGTESPVRKAYVSPKVLVYGDIHEVTRAIASNTKVADGGTGKTNKTG